MMYDNEKHDSVKFWKGIVIGLVVCIPLWVGVFYLTTWLLP